MGFFKEDSPRKIGFDDIKYSLKFPDKYLVINTLTFENQDCLISGTILAIQEEALINKMLESADYKVKTVIIYGKNASDNTVYKRYYQMLNLGFTEVYIYGGGLFEWLLLQDIYSFSEFPTTKKGADILRYRETPILNIYRIGY